MAAPKLRFKEFDEKYKSILFKDIEGFSIKSGKSNGRKETGKYSFYGSTGLIGYKDDYDYTGEAILIARVGANAGSLYKVEGKYSVSDNTLMLSASANISLNYIRELLIKFNLNKLVFGTGQPLVTGGLIKKISVSVPKPEEQTKIATFLSAVDTKIDELIQKHELLTDYKKGMMQQIFSQKLRFKADDGSDFEDWELATLDNHIEDSKSKSRINNEYEVFTSSRYGLVSQSEYFENSRLADRDNTGFNIIHPKEITYRSRSDDGMFFFNQNYLGKTGIVSTYYPVFSMVKGNNKFLCEYLNFYKYEYIKHAVGTSQLVLSLNSLKKIKFRIPTKEEQTKIANFLTAIDQKIDNVAEQIDHAKTWKKGLLQQMFV